jgi:hypothetical protein
MIGMILPVTYLGFNDNAYGGQVGDFFEKEMRKRKQSQITALMREVPMLLPQLLLRLAAKHRQPEEQITV